MSHACFREARSPSAPLIPQPAHPDPILERGTVLELGSDEELRKYQSSSKETLNGQTLLNNIFLIAMFVKLSFTVLYVDAVFNTTHQSFRFEINSDPKNWLSWRVNSVKGILNYSENFMMCILCFDISK